RRVDHRAVFKRHAADAPAGMVYRSYFGPGPDLNTAIVARRRHGFGDRAHPAYDMPRKSLPLLGATAQQVEQEAHRGTGLVGAARLAVEAVGQSQPLDRSGSEVTVEEIAERAG